FGWGGIIGTHKQTGFVVDLGLRMRIKGVTRPRGRNECLRQSAQIGQDLGALIGLRLVGGERRVAAACIGAELKVRCEHWVAYGKRACLRFSQTCHERHRWVEPFGRNPLRGVTRSSSPDGEPIKSIRNIAPCVDLSALDPDIGEVYDK